MPKLYYTAPSDEIFNEVKEKAIELWKTMGSEPSYSLGKIARIKDLENISDNMMFMVAMFDINNQKKLADKLSDEAKKAINDRMGDVGNGYNVFITS